MFDTCEVTTLIYGSPPERENCGLRAKNSVRYKYDRGAPTLICETHTDDFRALLLVEIIPLPVW